MQFKTFTLSALLLALPEAVFAANGVQYVQALGMSRKDSFLDMQPQFFADHVKGGSLAKRQSCPGAIVCYDGCCDIGYVCGIYGGQKGCCPVGKTCNRVGGCQNPSDVYCTTYCCPSGTTCGVDSNGDKACLREDSRCDAGYTLCKEFDGCCPNGVRCILPKNCAIPCAADDPVCGNGCCEKGFYCTKDEKCAKLNQYTSLEGPTTTTLLYTRTIAPKTSSTPVDTTTTPDPTTDSTTGSTTDSTPTDTEPSSTATYPPSSSTNYYPTSRTTTRRQTVTTQTLPPATGAGAAPTMGAMLGGGLGMAAGILGVFV